MKSIALAVVGLLSLIACSKPPAAVAAPATPQPDSAEYSRCMDKAVGDFDMRDCIVAEKVKIDAQLNRTYQALMNALDNPNERQALVASERAWIAFRDAECRHQAAEDEGGTSWSVAINECGLRMTRARLASLLDDLQHVKELADPA